MHRPPEDSLRALTENRRRYELLVEAARLYAAQGDVELALRATMLAANYAWMAPVGLLSDLRLERIVVRAVRGAGQVVVDGDRRTGRVLHVLSEAYSIGGHTRLVWRWIDRDDRTCDVVLTNQDGPVPERLVQAARDSGGHLHDLRSSTPGLLDRARALREHMDRADLVVLHVHPYDPVPLAAAHLPGVRPPVIYENHADQAFWLGVAGTDLLCDLRPQARALDMGLRAVPEERIEVLPMPVDAMPSAAGGDLRHRLGIGPDAVVALTVSADWKMAASWGRGMHHAVDRILAWTPQVVVVLVGATPNREWARLAKRYPGRVHPIGTVPDPAPWFALADVYIESYPTRATTSALEAAVLGLPVATLVDITEDDPAHIFQAGSPGLAGSVPAPTLEKFAVAVRRLAADPALRRHEGEAVRAAALSVHDGAGWRSCLEDLYRRARQMSAADADELGESPTDDRYGAMLLCATGAPTSADPRQLTDPLGELFDERMQADQFAVFQRDSDLTFSMRVADGWEARAEWTSRLLALAATYRRLAVSLPFAAGDDARGSATVQRLTDLLAGLGRTTEDCGDISLEGRPTRPTGPAVTGELPLTDAALDGLEGLLRSPFWHRDDDTGTHDLVPTGAPAMVP